MTGTPYSWRLALPMYRVTSALGLAWDALLQAVMAGLRQRGWSDAMQIETAPDELMDFWRSPDLLLSQTCGYPLVTALQHTVQVLAVPEFDLPGCTGVRYCSAIVVPQHGARTLQELRGAVAAVNGPHSHSGMNALRHAIAPLARDGRFFSKVLLSGSHMSSLALVQRGEADVAAIDCVSYALTARHAPERVTGVRVLQYSEPAPGLPLIASTRLDAGQVSDLLDVLTSLHTSAPALMESVSIRRFVGIGLADYEPILDQARLACEQGYPELA